MKLSFKEIMWLKHIRNHRHIPALTGSDYVQRDIWKRMAEDWEPEEWVYDYNKTVQQRAPGIKPRWHASYSMPTLNCGTIIYKDWATGGTYRQTIKFMRF